MSDTPMCGNCGTYLAHIDMACPVCLPNFYNPKPKTRMIEIVPCPFCDNGIVRSLGRDNDEILTNCDFCNPPQNESERRSNEP